jgi:hypothetical protein
VDWFHPISYFKTLVVPSMTECFYIVHTILALASSPAPLVSFLEASLPPFAFTFAPSPLSSAA